MPSVSEQAAPKAEALGLASRRCSSTSEWALSRICKGLFVQFCSGLFVQICLFRYVCSSLFSHICCSDLFVQIRFFRFVCSDLFLHVGVFIFDCSDLLVCILWFRFVCSDSFVPICCCSDLVVHIRFLSDLFLWSQQHSTITKNGNENQTPHMARKGGQLMKTSA